MAGKGTTPRRRRRRRRRTYAAALDDDEGRFDDVHLLKVEFDALGQVRLQDAVQEAFQRQVRVFGRRVRHDGPDAGVHLAARHVTEQHVGFDHHRVVCAAAAAAAAPKKKPVHLPRPFRLG